MRQLPAVVAQRWVAAESSGRHCRRSAQAPRAGSQWQLSNKTEARPPPKGAKPVKESWEEVRTRILNAQIQMEADAKKTKKMPRYAGPRVLGYLYVGPGHVVNEMRGAPQVRWRCDALLHVRGCIRRCIFAACMLYATCTLYIRRSRAT